MNEYQLIPGIRAAYEILEGQYLKILELWISEGRKGSRVRDILRRAERREIPVKTMKAGHMDRILPDVAHQGVVLKAEKYHYADLNRMIDRAVKSKAFGLIIMADHITDEGNLGALIRTAAFFGANGLVLPKDRSAKMSLGVMKRSAGAFVHLPIAQVVNLGRTLDTLNEHGFWIIGTAGESLSSVYEFDWNRNVVLILGSEDRGLSQSVKKRCHQIIGIPRTGRIDSLNVSVACGVILSEMIRQRTTKTHE